MGSGCGFEVTMEVRVSITQEQRRTLKFEGGLRHVSYRVSPGSRLGKGKGN
jgi:hypothetical protein